MKAGTLFLAVVALLVACEANAAGLPDWLLGDWVVTKVYQLNDDLIHYRNSEAEPVVRLTGKVMSIDANRLHLDVDICADLVVEERLDTVRHLVKRELGGEPGMYGGLAARPGRLSYLHINCGRSSTEEEEGLEDSRQKDINWIIIPNGRNKIDLIFLRPCYVELRRKEKPVS